ncbi:glycosyltransferase [Pelagicoccus enzymogenes]|uniref:glycosyltransferase n=1 Tax=Pelagicoccus enzymogenes TaxID=2773457 RepID=UPI00280F9435|nr:glycosyltransferase [Pelagicoccus enzymogenes]MDQ8199783.1 glycosyltransferase [Pelagicoccus enzymogenes]
MNTWIVQLGEQLQGIDSNTKAYRYTKLAQTLANRGHSVTRISNTFDHANKKFRFESFRSVNINTNLKVDLLHATPGYKRNISIERIIQQRRAAKLFYNYAEQQPKPDIIVAGIPVLEVAESCANFAKQNNIPLIIDVQDIWPDVYLEAFPQIARPLAKKLLKREYSRLRKSLSEAEAITATSGTYLNWSLKHANRSPRPLDRIFPLGTDAILKGPQIASNPDGLPIPPNKKLFTFCGTFGKTYDTDALTETAKLLSNNRRNDIHILAAGNGDKLNKARAGAQGLDTITLPGYIDQPTLQSTLLHSTAGLCAYSSAATQVLPYKPFEYMAAGLPLISSLPGELEQIIKTNQIGLQYEAGNHISLYEAIVRVADSNTIEMRSRSKTLFEAEYDSTVLYSKFSRHLESIIQELS